MSHLSAPDQGYTISIGQDPAAHLEADTEAGVEEGEYCTRPKAASTWPEQGEAVDDDEDVVDQDVRHGAII